MNPALLIGIIAGAFILRGVLHDTRIPFFPQIVDTASRYGVPTSLALAQIKKESGFDPGAVSDKGARGLMQIMPGALADVNAKLGTSFTFNDMFDPERNLLVGFTYLDMKREQYGSLYRGYIAFYSGHFPDAQGEEYANDIFRISQEF